jgi:hypothetical protein
MCKTTLVPATRSGDTGRLPASDFYRTGALEGKPRVAPARPSVADDKEVAVYVFQREKIGDLSAAIIGTPQATDDKLS